MHYCTGLDWNINTIFNSILERLLKDYQTLSKCAQINHVQETITVKKIRTGELKTHQKVNILPLTALTEQ